MSRTAIVAGQGALPGLVAEALDAPLVYALEGFAPAIPAQAFRLERLVPLLDAMADSDVSRVVFAGAVRRPRPVPQDHVWLSTVGRTGGRSVGRA